MLFELRQLRRLRALLHAVRDERGARPEARDLRVRGELPEHIGRRCAVVQDDRRAGEQAADQEVPHHPARRREPEEAVVGGQVRVQVRLLQVLEQDPALPLHDRLWQPRRARRVEDPQRVVERHLLERQLIRLGQLPLATRQVRHRDRVLQGRDRLAKLRDLLRAVEVLAVVAVPVDRQQHLRLDLLEAVDHRRRTELGRGARPDRADARGGEKRRDRLRDVRHVGDHAVASLDPEAAQLRRHACGHVRELGPSDLGQLAQLRSVHDRRLARAHLAEEPLRVVQVGAREPLGAGHLAGREHTVMPARDLEVLPQRRPERVQVLDRPAPQLVVGLKAAIEPAHVVRQPRVLDPLG